MVISSFVQTPRATRLLLLVALAATSPAAAQGGLYGEEDGFFVFLDAALLTTPGDTDQVLGESRDLRGTTQQTSPMQIDWESSPSAAAGFGYRWDANRVSVSFWQFDDDETFAANGPPGGQINFAIGPASYFYNVAVGFYPIYTYGVPGSVDFRSSIEASLIDVAWGHTEPIGDFFDLEWSVGVRFASFEERLDGRYDICATSGCDYPYSLYFVPGDAAFDVAKTNEGDMFGVRVGAEGTYFFSDIFAISSGLAFSMLNGELESTSGLTPVGVINGADPPTLAVAMDDDRTGSIREVEVGFHFFVADERLRISLGLAHARWEGVAGDLARSTPGILAANKDRDFVSFSSVILGFRFDF